MAQPQRPPAAKKPPAKSPPAKNQVGAWVVVLLVSAMCVVPIGIGVVNGIRGGGTTVVPGPTATERADTVAVLKKAADAQGICYGWRLSDGTRQISVGSNLGDGVEVVDNPNCPRWVEVIASVYYTSSSSEANDWAGVQVDSSQDIRSYSLSTRLDRFELDDEAFIDDPGWAICRAATTLPLLTAEIGAADPAPVTTGAASFAPGTSMNELPEAGNDLWRDRWGFLLAVVGLLLVTVLLITVGLVQRSRQRR